MLKTVTKIPENKLLKGTFQLLQNYLKQRVYILFYIAHKNELHLFILNQTVEAYMFA